jgi:hypothetical protein
LYIYIEIATFGGVKGEKKFPKKWGEKVPLREVCDD